MVLNRRGTMPRRQFWLVHMRNVNDLRDSEVWKIRASTAEVAKMIAVSSSNAIKFEAGRVIPARGGKPRERELAKEMREMITRTFP